MSTAHPLHLSTAALLEIWERGMAWHPIDQALLVLQYAYSGMSMAELSDCPIGQRDRLLLQVRRDLFGECIEACVECPSCGTKLEFQVSCSALAESRGDDNPVKKTVHCEGMEWELRAPNSHDLAAIINVSDVQAARQRLFARCATNVSLEHEPAPALSPDTQHRLEAELATLDPHAELLIDLSCRACAHSWQTLFDITIFLWSEIRTKTRRLLQEVDVLARTYGWTQSDILALSPTRRSWYVQMALS